MDKIMKEIHTNHVKNMNHRELLLNAFDRICANNEMTTVEDDGRIHVANVPVTRVYSGADKNLTMELSIDTSQDDYTIEAISIFPQDLWERPMQKGYDSEIDELYLALGYNEKELLYSIAESLKNNGVEPVKIADTETGVLLEIEDFEIDFKLDTSYLIVGMEVKQYCNTYPEFAN